MTNHISTPLTLPCGLTFANRLVKSATSEQLASEHRMPTRAHHTLYARWARGGVGAMITGNVMVDPFCRVARGDVALVETSPIGPFRAWARAAGDVPLLMQLSHPGRQSSRNLDAEPVAPSRARVRRGGVFFGEPRPLDAREIRAVVAAFGLAARRAEEAGFAGVQVHAAHGYLVHQFLSARTNTRDDLYGGDAPRRRRFLLEILSEIRSVVHPRFAVSVKLNVPDGASEGAPDANEGAANEWAALLRALEDHAVDLIELSGGTYERDAVFGVRSRKVEVAGVKHEAFFAAEAHRLRGLSRLPTLLTGGVRSRVGALRVVESGVADAVGLARWLVLDPDLPLTLMRGEEPQLPSFPSFPLGRFAAPLELAWYEQRLLALAGARVDLGAGATLGRVLRKYAW